MKIGMAQISMTESVKENFNKTLEYCKKAAGCDLLFFPEIQLSPFFPQYAKQHVDEYCMNVNDDRIHTLQEQAKGFHYYLSPNIYIEEDHARYDSSLWINPEGELEDISKMVHIAQVEQFYEQDYYTPSNDGFKVYDTPHGKIGIVICYDRHLPESIRTCALKGAQLIIIPTANTKAEPLEMFEWEIRVQAMQNQVFIAMCNRVGLEGNMDFAGQSLVVNPKGDVLIKADDMERLVTCEIDLQEASEVRNECPYIATRRPEWYVR